MIQHTFIIPIKPRLGQKKKEKRLVLLLKSKVKADLLHLKILVFSSQLPRGFQHLEEVSHAV